MFIRWESFIIGGALYTACAVLLEGGGFRALVAAFFLTIALVVSNETEW